MMRSPKIVINGREALVSPTVNGGPGSGRKPEYKAAAHLSTVASRSFMYHNAPAIVKDHVSKSLEAANISKDHKEAADNHEAVAKWHEAQVGGVNSSQHREAAQAHRQAAAAHFKAADT